MYRARLEMALELLGPERYAKLLEAGCGSGIMLPSLRARAGRLYAMDIHKRHDLVSRMLRCEGVEAALGVGNVCALGYSDAAFDAVVCMSTLEHLHGEELTAAIVEFGRVLRAGGVAVVGVPATGWLMDVLFRAIGFWDIDDHHVSTRDSIRAELARHFSIEAERHMPGRGAHAFTLYSAFLCRKEM
ncbi:MAG: class I SAM-dependent methyltransferase [Chloroflexota bacterium]